MVSSWRGSTCAHSAVIHGRRVLGSDGASEGLQLGWAVKGYSACDAGGDSGKLSPQIGRGGEKRLSLQQEAKKGAEDTGMGEHELQVTGRVTALLASASRVVKQGCVRFAPSPSFPK